MDNPGAFFLVLIDDTIRWSVHAYMVVVCFIEIAFAILEVTKGVVEEMCQRECFRHVSIILLFLLRLGCFLQGLLDVLLQLCEFIVYVCRKASSDHIDYHRNSLSLVP